MKEKWEKEFDETFEMSDHQYSLMEERLVLGGREQLVKIKTFIKELLKENFISKKELQEVLEGMERYPEDVFSSPPEGWKKDIDEFCKTKGYRIDHISAWYGRWMQKSLTKEIKERLL